MKKLFIAIGGLLFLTLLVIGVRFVWEKTTKEVAAMKDNLHYTAKVNQDTFEVFTNGEWKELTVKGVNMGMAKPGKFPGEAAITHEEYTRWLEMIGEMGANTIRVYTLHPPSFYEALKKYNDKHEQPIYLFHGVWINEESLGETLDAFATAHTEEFQSEMKSIVDVIHGNAKIEARPGHASGKYKADISEYVIGWILGIEWYPYMVNETNLKHANIGDYQGKYVTTNEAQPFEYWLAEQMDTILTYESKEYQWMRPISFTNWVTTDLLDHPSEPSEDEDMATVNPNVIQLKNVVTETNQFASYHVYPYYPDFFNYEEAYLNYKDHRGENNSYAAYLHELHEAHDIPVLIAEFGIPSSRGLTHENHFGWNQGFMSEQEQGEIVKRLYEDILYEGMLGGLVFTWQDEWFKRTWNTMDYDDPDRRPFWSNAQTGEQQFGLLSFDRLKQKVDGNTKGWKKAKSLYKGSNQLLQSLAVDHDERYLYFKIELEGAGTLFKDVHPMILLDTIPNQGNQHINGIDGLTIERGIDFIVDLKGIDNAAIQVDPYYDFFRYQYTHQMKMLDPERPLPTKNSGTYEPIYLTLNKELFIPSQDKVIPFSYYETGKLRHGNGNPDSATYDSLADFYVNEEDGIIEVRIPWLLLNVKDPSTLEIMDDLYGDNPNGDLTIKGINVGMLLLQEEDNTYKVADSFPALDQGILPAAKMERYTWKGWEEPKSEERLKQSYYILQELFQSID